MKFLKNNSMLEIKEANPNEAEEIIKSSWGTSVGIAVTRTSRVWSYPDYDDMIIYEYEFEYNGEKVRPMTFKPDFPAKDGSFIIECKGFGNDAFPLRWKLFKALLHRIYGEYGPKIYVVKNQEQVRNAIKDIKND